MSYDDERDYEEEAAVRTAYEAEYRAEAEEERQAERIARVHRRLTFGIEADGIRLHIDGTPHRILIEAPRRKRDLPPLVPLLNQAAEYGAIHGRCNQMAELAADLLNQPGPPGHVLYEREPNGSLTMHRDDTATPLPLPDGMKPFYVIGQTVRALSDMFALAGEIADEPAPAPAAEPASPADDDEHDPGTVHVVRDALAEPAAEQDHGA